MPILRNLRESTRVLFLYEVIANRHSRLRTIAERLEMTIQGASDYAHGLQRDGLLTVAAGEYRATKKGIEFLLDRTHELRMLVERIGRSIAPVETTAAIARTPVRSGDRVGLFMEGGHLVAYAGRASPSIGTAGHDAQRGEDLAVRDLEGIVSLHPGRITLVRVPPVRIRGPRAMNPTQAKKVQRRGKGAIVAALDIEGVVAARRLNLEPRIEFAVVQATLEAAERGVDVLLFLTEDRAADVVQAIEATNARLEDKIPYESLGLS